MTFSVNTNSSALIALQNLTATATQLTQTQNIISTGLKVATAKDDGATWAIAQNSRAQVSSLNSVKDSLNRASSTVDVAVSAGGTISDLLSQLKAKALAASDSSLDANSRVALNNDFVSLRNQITTVVSNASFNGANLISASAPNVSALANDSGAAFTVQAQSLALGGSNNTLSATATIGSATAAAAVVTTLTTAIGNVNGAVAKLGTSSNALHTHLTFIGSLQDTLTTGIGNLVDADLAKESATLQALQSKQQLGVQALSIANSSTNSILSLFR